MKIVVDGNPKEIAEFLVVIKELVDGKRDIEEIATELCQIFEETQTNYGTL